ncbi:TPA: zinc ribbon domain-containing protein [Candidatus Bathyarchaeota archaeon]|nr:zinc ribbon domain-containing protein [Candidatus Bathyarchaeota archaeon]
MIKVSLLLRRPKCGSNVGADAKFCPKCGARMRI